MSILDPGQLRSELKSGKLYPVYLLAGADTFRAEKTARWLRSRVVQDASGELNAESLWADEKSPAQIAEAAAAYPMFGGRRFVWVRHAEKLAAGTAVEPMLRYLQNPVESTVLVLTSSKLDKRLKFTTQCADRGRVVEFAPLRGADLAAQVGRQASGYGLSLRPEAVHTLLDLVGDDLAELDQELQKMSLLSPDASGALGSEEVRALVARSRDIDGFELADRFDARDPAGLLEGWTELRRRGSDPFGTAAILHWRLRQLIQLAEAKAAGFDDREAGTRTGMSPWQLRRVMPLVHNSSAEQLRATLEGMRQAERRAKGSSLGAGLAYDLALLDWAGRASA